MFKKKIPQKNNVQSSVRRNNNEGSIFQRKSDGKWVGSFTVGYDKDGKQKKKVVYGKSRIDVAKKMSEISGRIKSDTYETIENKTLGELMLEWLLVFKKSAVTPRTFEGIMGNFRLHIEPQIGNMKIYEIDTMVVQKVINNLIDQEYSNNVVKKNKHLISQFFEYAIDNKWVQVNPTSKIKVKIHDRKTYDNKEKYKALEPEIRALFLEKLDKDESNFLKPMCITMMFAGLRAGEAIALKWKNVDFEHKTIKVEQAITQVPKFDNEGNVLKRITVVGDTKTTCSVREIPVADIVIETLRVWKERQQKRQTQKKRVKAELTAPTSFVFGNDDGSVRTYSGTRKIFNRFLRRNNLNKYNIHFHGLRHTFSNMLFEMNENPKVIQQLLGHRDVKTTITVYNSVDSEYIRQTTDKFNEKLKQDQLLKEKQEEEKETEEKKKKLLADILAIEEIEKLLADLIEARKAQSQHHEQDDEMEM